MYIYVTLSVNSSCFIFLGDASDLLEDRLFRRAISPYAKCFGLKNFTTGNGNVTRVANVVFTDLAPPGLLLHTPLPLPLPLPFSVYLSF